MTRYVEALVVVVALALFLAAPNSSVAASELVHPMSAVNSLPAIPGSSGNITGATPAFPTLRYARVLVYATLHTVGEGSGQGTSNPEA